MEPENSASNFQKIVIHERCVGRRGEVARRAILWEEMSLGNETYGMIGGG